MVPAPDYDSRERASRRLAYVLAVAFYLFAYWLCRTAYGPLLGFVVSSPVLGVYAALWMRFGSESTWRWFKWLALRKVDGRHYAFQDHPIGIRLSEGQCWVRAQDAFAVVKEKPDEAALRRLSLRFGDAAFQADASGQWWFAEDAIMAWLAPRAARHDPVANRFALWLGREVFPPMRRRAEIS